MKTLVNQLPMYARIKKNAYVFASHSYSSSTELRNWLKEKEGELVQIETDHLFNNQYNTEKFRIYDSMIEEIINDARVNKGKCKYCGTMLHRDEVICLKHGECVNYGVEWFTPDNTYFLKYPAGIKAIEKETNNTTIKIGTYYLESYACLDYMRLRNNRKTINFKYADGKFYVNNGIGYTQVKYLDVPYSVHSKLVQAIKKLLA